MDPTLLVIVLVVVLALAVGGWLFFRGRKPQEESFYHFRCGKCKRRLRYLERQVGHKGKCSNCGSDVLFPPVSQAVD